MSQKTERPTLQGQRFRTRKRDEREKFNPIGFRDIILNSLDTLTPGKIDCLEIESILKCLLSDIRIGYRVYGEQLFDILIAGGILAPGGNIITDLGSGERCETDICLFKAVDSDDLQTIKNFANIFVRLIQRFGFLEKTLEEEFKKIIVFLKAFEPDNHIKLAKITAALISQGVLSPVVLLSGIQDHLVRDGTSLDFLINVLKTWIDEKDPNTVWNSIRRAGVDRKLVDFLAPNKRDPEILIQTFQDNGLTSLITFMRTKESEAKKSELQKKIATQVKAKANSKEIIELIEKSIEKDQFDECEILVLIWKTLMSVVEWNKKEELVAEQALRHLRTYSSLLEEYAKSGKAQLALIIKVQEYCYENMNFLKAFHRIIILFYQTDVLHETIIIEWYNRSHSNKGKSVFLEQTKRFVEWLTGAEYESD